jgi:hypothetical protein
MSSVVAKGQLSIIFSLVLFIGNFNHGACHGRLANPGTFLSGQRRPSPYSDPLVASHSSFGLTTIALNVHDDGFGANSGASHR